MAYSITGFVYLYGFLALAFLSYRFYSNWQREETVVSKGFFLFVVLMDLFFFITAIGGLLFADSPQFLKWVVVGVVFFQSSAASVLGYVIPYMKFPKFSPWLGFSIIFLSGIVATFLAALTAAFPFLEPNGVINWNLGPSTEILRPLLFLGTILPVGIILIKQGLYLKPREARIKAIGLGWIFLVGVVAGLIDFTLTSVFHLGSISNVISIFILATSMLLLVVFTQKLPGQAKLILLRHLQSQWNKENRFTGWTDVPLSREGIESAKEVAGKLVGFKIDKIYTSPLIRNRETVSLVIGDKNLPIMADKALDERNYGKLQGLNKDEVKKQYGEEQVKLWRRSWDQAPPEGESLKDVYNRAVPFFQKHIENDLKNGKNILVVASHNSLRAIVKYLEKISDDDIINFEIKPGELKIYNNYGIQS